MERQSSLSGRSAGAPTLGAANIQLEAPFAGHQIIEKRLPLVHMTIGVSPVPPQRGHRLSSQSALLSPLRLIIHLVKSYEFDQYLGYVRGACNPDGSYFQSAARERKPTRNHRDRAWIFAMKVAIAALIGAAVIAGAIALSHRYTIAAASGGDAAYAWRIDQWSGQITLCKSDAYKIWCMPVTPDQRH